MHRLVITVLLFGLLVMPAGAEPQDPRPDPAIAPVQAQDEVRAGEMEIQAFREMLKSVSGKASSVSFDDASRTLSARGLSASVRQDGMVVSFDAESATMRNFRLEAAKGQDKQEPVFDAVILKDWRFRAVEPPRAEHSVKSPAAAAAKTVQQAAGGPKAKPAGKSGEEKPARPVIVEFAGRTLSVDGIASACHFDGADVPEGLKGFKSMNMGDVTFSYEENGAAELKGACTAMAIACPPNGGTVCDIEKVRLDIPSADNVEIRCRRISLRDEHHLTSVVRQFSAIFDENVREQQSLFSAGGFSIRDTVLALRLDAAHPEQVSEYTIAEISSRQSAMSGADAPVDLDFAIRGIRLPASLWDMPLGLTVEQVRALKAFLPDGTSLSFDVSCMLPPKQRPGSLTVGIRSDELFDLKATLDVRTDVDAIPCTEELIKDMLKNHCATDAAEVRFADRGLVALAAVIGGQSMGIDAKAAAAMAGITLGAVLPPGIAPAARQMLEKPGVMTVKFRIPKPIPLARLADFEKPEGLTMEGKTEQGARGLEDFIPASLKTK